MTEHARNADPVVLHYAEEMTSADPTTNFALYSQVCIASDHGTQKVKALPFLRSAIAQQFNLSESSSFVKDFASVINVTVIDLGCDRTAPLNQNSPAAVDFNP